MQRSLDCEIMTRAVKRHCAEKPKLYVLDQDIGRKSGCLLSSANSLAQVKEAKAGGPDPS